MGVYEEESKKIINVREQAIMGIRNLSIMEKSTTQDIAKLLDVHTTIFSIVKPYYSLIREISDRDTTKPNFNLSLENLVNEYKDFLFKNTSYQYHGTDGLYKEDTTKPGSRIDEINESCPYITNFELANLEGQTSLTNRLKKLIVDIGEKASNSKNRRGPFDTEALAISQRDKDKGSGYLGLRTENNNIYSTTTVNDPSGQPLTQWWIGQESQHGVTPIVDYYDNPNKYDFKVELIGYLDNLGLGNFSSLSSIINRAKDKEFKEIVNTWKISNIDTTSQRAILRENLNSYLNDLISLYNNLNGIAVDSNGNANATTTDTINQYLQELIDLANNIIAYLEPQVDLIQSWLPNSIFKSLVFWNRYLTTMPDSTIAQYKGIKENLPLAQARLQKADSYLREFITPTQTIEIQGESYILNWLNSPTNIAIYNQPIFNLDKTLKRIETIVSWQPNLTSSSYRVYAKTDNFFTPFVESDLIGVVTSINENGFLNNFLSITPPTSTTIFGVQAVEDNLNPNIPRADNLNSLSMVSTTLSDEFYVESRQEFNKTVLNVSKGDILKFKLSNNDFIKVGENEIVQIESISDNDYMLEKDIQVIGANIKIQKIYGLYRTSES